MKNNTQTKEPVTGVYADSAFGGIEIIGDIEYGNTDYIYWRFNYGKPGPIHRAKIYDGANPYFRTPRGKVYFKNILRV